VCASSFGFANNSGGKRRTGIPSTTGLVIAAQPLNTPQIVNARAHASDLFHGQHFLKPKTPTFCAMI
jgi:hypothetical protein